MDSGPYTWTEYVEGGEMGKHGSGEPDTKNPPSKGGGKHEGPKK